MAVGWGRGGRKPSLPPRSQLTTWFAILCAGYSPPHYARSKCPPAYSKCSNNSLCLPCACRFFSSRLSTSVQHNAVSSIWSQSGSLFPYQTLPDFFASLCNKTPFKTHLYSLTPLLPVFLNLSKAGFITQSSHESAVIKVTRDFCIVNSNGQLPLFLLLHLASALWAQLTTGSSLIHFTGLMRQYTLSLQY